MRNEFLKRFVTTRFRQNKSRLKRHVTEYICTYNSISRHSNLTSTTFKFLRYRLPPPASFTPPPSYHPTPTFPQPFFITQRLKQSLALTSASVRSLFCHCDSCRRAHAAPLYQVVYLPESCFEITTGAHLLQAFARSPAHVVRSFCSACGSRICNRVTAKPSLGVG